MLRLGKLHGILKGGRGAARSAPDDFWNGTTWNVWARGQATQYFEERHNRGQWEKGRGDKGNLVPVEDAIHSEWTGGASDAVFPIQRRGHTSRQ